MDTLIHSGTPGPSAGVTDSPGDVLARLIDSGGACVGVIGLGYVGLPLVPAIASAGYRVLGFDQDDKKVALLARGRSYIRHIPGDAIAPWSKAARSKRSRTCPGSPKPTPS